MPTWAFAWGPITHMYLGSEALLLAGAALPAAVSALIKRYKQDFLYGNIMADSIMAKKYLPLEHHPHNWDVALELYESAGTDQERSFALGYLCHLAADTVAHGPYTSKYGHLAHTFIEFRADSFISQGHWQKALTIDKQVRRRNNAFLARRLHTAFFSHKANRKLFKGYVVFSGLGTVGRRVKNFAGLRRKTLSGFGTEKEIRALHDDSLKRMVAVLTNPTDSDVLDMSAIAATPEPSAFLKAQAG